MSLPKLGLVLIRNVDAPLPYTFFGHGIQLIVKEENYFKLPTILYSLVTIISDDFKNPETFGVNTSTRWLYIDTFENALEYANNNGFSKVYYIAYSDTDDIYLDFESLIGSLVLT